MLLLHIRRRWPVLTAVLAGLAYIANNYTISGIENLSIQAINSSPTDSNPGVSRAGGRIGLEDFSFDLTQFGIDSGNEPDDLSAYLLDPYGNNTSGLSPTWQNLLSAGEKLALWQNRYSGNRQPVDGINAAVERGLPSASPIPAPVGVSVFGRTNGSAELQQASPAPFADFVPLSAPSATGWPEHGGTARALAPITAVTTPSVNVPDVEGPDVDALGLMTATLSRSEGQAANGRLHSSIRVASFRLQAFGPASLAKPHVLQVIVQILRQYDVVALQGIQTSRDDILPLLIEKLNQSGRSFDYIIGPRVGRGSQRQQYAFVFDTARLETDRFQLYTVDDPEDLMHSEPLVAWFRCKGPPKSDAFTFSLVNIAIEPSFADSERAMLPQLIEAIENDGRGEDDWILAGDFAGGNAELSMLDENAIRFAIRDIPTDIEGTQMLDTILFSSRATSEFTGKAGAFDFLRRYNLSFERALEIGGHMPIWAEFSTIEGAEPGRVAPLSPQSVF
jgi:hypothetical protein